jgi:hypothetical protein
VVGGWEKGVILRAAQTYRIVQSTAYALLLGKPCLL